MLYNLDIPGWINGRDLEVLAKLASMVPPKGQIVEVGSYLGRTAWTFSKASHPTVQVYCVDLWDDLPQERTDYAVRPTLKAFLENVNDCPNVTPIKGGSTSIDWPVNNKADLIFVDADHTSPQIDADLDFWIERLTSDGVIAGDDFNLIYWPDVCRAVIRLSERLNKPIKGFGKGYIWAIEMQSKEPEGDEYLINPVLLDTLKELLEM